MSKKLTDNFVQQFYIYVHLGVSFNKLQNEQVHEISNNVVCATSKASDQPAHTRSLI